MWVVQRNAQAIGGCAWSCTPMGSLRSCLTCVAPVGSGKVSACVLTSLVAHEADVRYPQRLGEQQVRQEPPSPNESRRPGSVY
jgi:hypothetical protein